MYEMAWSAGISDSFLSGMLLSNHRPVQLDPDHIWTPPDPRRIRLRAKYNDLDLILMDGLSPSDAYPEKG